MTVHHNKYNQYLKFSNWPTPDKKKTHFKNSQRGNNDNAPDGFELMTFQSVADPLYPLLSYASGYTLYVGREKV